MKKLIYSAALVSALLLAACSSDEAAPVEEKTADAANEATYKIEEETLNGTIWNVVISTTDVDETKLKEHIESVGALAADKKEQVDSVFVNVKIADSVANTYAASGKVALTNKGLVQTGLTNTNEFEFNMSLKDTHLTSKEDLPQSNESYNSQTVLDAFAAAGLAVTDVRDNSHNCVSMECTSLLTTEEVSIYEWPSTEKAEEVQASGLGGAFGTAHAGTIIIRMNDNTVDAQPYIDTLNNVINQ